MAAFAAAAVAVTPSCTKTVQPDSFNQEVTLQENAALEEFAAVLSKVVTGSEEVRAFFKDEALKQFDRDFDVFYPYVKDHKFSSGETLREMLVANETYEGQIETIERAVPKLTVLIPDFSWLDADFFSVKNWDTTIDRLCVGFDDDATAHRLYFDGEYLGALPASNIPSFPVMIVKSNERMKVSISTKGGENSYSFADPAFDGTMDTKGWFTGGYDEVWQNDASDADTYAVTGNSITANELNGVSPISIQAYNEFSVGSTAGVQRDYIYYGMTKAKPKNGKLNVFVRDLLYRFRISVDGIMRMADDNGNGNGNGNGKGDPTYSTYLFTGTNDRPSCVDAIKRMWGSGKFEIHIQFFQSYPGNGASSVGSMVFSVSMDDLLYVKSMKHTWNWDWFSDWSTFTITEAELEPKWYYPGDKANSIQMITTSWDLSAVSDNLYIRVEEFDPAQTVTITKGRDFKRALSMSLNNEKIGLGITNSMEESYSDSYSVTTTHGSDELGDFPMYYVDNYIIARNSDGKYVLNAWGNEYINISFLPFDTRDKYSVQNFLLGRKSRLGK